MFKRKQRLNGIQINIQIKKNLGMLGMNLLSLTGLLLVFMLAAGFKAVPVLAAEASIVASGECGDEGDNVTWKLDSEGTLTISGSGAIECGENSGEDGEAWCNAGVPLKTIVIEEGVTYIPEYIFEEDVEEASLTRVEISSTVTIIGSGAFYGCKNLKEIVWSSGLQIIESYAFRECTSLTEVILPDGVETIEAYAFGECTGIKKVFIPSSVTLIEGAFFNCSQLETLEIDSNNANYSVEDGVLYNTDQTELIFCCASKSGEFIVPESVKRIGLGAFAGCTEITGITLSEKITGIPSRAFEGCTGLTTIILPEAVEYIGWSAFDDCDSLSEITVDINNQVYSSQDGILYDKDQTEVVMCPLGLTGEIVLPKTVASVGQAFKGCKKITKITIPEDITKIEEKAFYGCTNLKEIILPSSLKTIEYGAFGYTAITRMEIPESVAELEEYLFVGCNNLKELVMLGDAPVVEEDYNLGIYSYIVIYSNFPHR